MKKTILIAAAIAMAGISSFAQGNILFSGPSKGVWDNFSSSTPHLTGEGIYVALMFGTGTPTIASISGTGLLTAGNGGEYTSTNSINLNTSFSAATAWNDILNQSGWALVTGTNNVDPAQMAVSSSNGAFTYNAGSAWQSQNLTGGTVYNMYIIGWSSAYATPQLAAAANAAVGWSSYFSYTPAVGISTPPTFSGLATPFGVVATPEPSTMALAAIGGASLLLFRRRK